jgi:hypothetical protein
MFTWRTLASVLESRTWITPCAKSRSLDLWRGPESRRVCEECYAHGLGRLGAAQRRRHCPRVTPAVAGQHLERGPQIGDSPSQGALDLH